jgi:hypothetical protein
LAEGNANVLGGDDGDTARVVCRDPEQTTAVVSDYGVCIYVAIGEHEGEHPTMLGPTHDAGRWRTVRAKSTLGDIEGPASAERWVNALGMSCMGQQDESEG